MGTDTQASLYERLGGVYSIATVVDDFVDRIMVDPRLSANPRVDEAHHKVSPPGFKYLVTERACWAAGGPQHYTGRSMRDSQRHLLINATEWDAFLDDFQQTLDKFGVPQAEQAELKAIVASIRVPSFSGASRPARTGLRGSEFGLTAIASNPKHVLRVDSDAMQL
jgi:hemoglobin